MRFLHKSDVPSIDKTAKETGHLFGKGKNNDIETERYLNLNTLRKPEIFYSEIGSLSKDRVEKAHRLFNKFENYQIPVVTVKGREKSEVGTIFERINNTGTDLDTLDLMIAWTWSSDFNLREEIESILAVADEKGFGDIERKRVLQCISAIAVERISTDDILDSLNQPEEISSLLNRVRDSLGRAIDLLVNEFNIYGLKFLPSTFQIIPLVYLFSNVGATRFEHTKKVRKWFWRTSFTSRYRDATNQRVREDISFFAEVADNSSNVRADQFDVEVTTSRFFVDTKFHSRASATKAFILMLAQNKPQDLWSGEKISLNQTISSYSRKEYHHVFPRQYLYDHGYDQSLVDCLANRCLITSDTNKRISQKPPSEYLFDREGGLFDDMGQYDETKKEILRSNLLPADLDIYRNNDYQKFLSERKDILYEYFTDLVD